MKRWFFCLLCSCTLASSGVFGEWLWPTWDDHRFYKPYWYDHDHSFEAPKRSCAEWLPEQPVLFEPFVADPRQTFYSIGYRRNDDIFSDNVVDVSFADTLAIMRWYDVGMFGADLQIELEGALWALFEPWEEDAPLINADYYIGFPITYAFGPWSIRWRLYHISSHLGDEFMIVQPNVKRLNPSAEYTDIFLSYYLCQQIRLYGGLGYILHRDDSYPCHRTYGEFGAELHLNSMGHFFESQHVFIQPYYGMHFRVQEDNDWMIDQTYVLGFEVGKTTGLQRKTRIFLQYHDGNSLEGQFAKCRTSYWSIRGSYGY